MIIPLDISEFEVNQYKFENFEIIEDESEIYLLSETDYIPIKKLDQLVSISSSFYLVSEAEKEVKFQLTEQQFQQLYELLSKLLTKC